MIYSTSSYDWFNVFLSKMFLADLSRKQKKF